MTTAQPPLAEMALALELRTRWGVDDGQRLIESKGFELCKLAHQHMLRLARAQKLLHVERLSGYFVQTLNSTVIPEPVEADPDPRSDQFIEQYLERQKARHS